MSIKKLDDGQYQVDIRPQGAAGRRIRRRFSKKAEAQAYEKYILVNFHAKEWVDKPADKRPLCELIELWWVYGGRNQKHGNTDRLKLEKIDRDMGRPMVYMLTRKFLMEYRSRRLHEGMQATTVNRDLCCLSGMFTLLQEAEEFHGDNPVHSLKKLKPKNTEMSFLSDDEIKKLLSVMVGDDLRVAVLCLNTGARWGEVSNLKAEQVIGNRVTFVETKNSKKRSVPISDEVVSMIMEKKSGRLFDADYTRFRNLLREVKPDLPKGQATHVLRHTFATHFMINGGSLITLQRILGHATIQQTMTYAHFAPDYLSDAITLNPLRGMSTYCPPVRAV
ncbi:tyrosine-type recombinase/integrase [Serratia fonticola]|uniref:phage integrase n=1 Tax=Serratia fonticola TaxID=47917 RepID=UPI0016447ECF|nr:tyrosine-type recombinase/integrase [Serratia fonticola]MBC3250942.1 tyrosine-type recombinase/integrase [Serratia fonticola]